MIGGIIAFTAAAVCFAGIVLLIDVIAARRRHAISAMWLPLAAFFPILTVMHAIVASAWLASGVSLPNNWTLRLDEGGVNATIVDEHGRVVHDAVRRGGAVGAIVYGEKRDETYFVGVPTYETKAEFEAALREAGIADAPMIAAPDLINRLRDRPGLVVAVAGPPVALAVLVIAFVIAVRRAPARTLLAK